MKKRNYSSGVFFAVILFSALFLISIDRINAQEKTGSVQSRPNPTGDGTSPVASAGYVSGLFSILPGQTVRVSAVNMGKKAIPLEIVFVAVSEQGKAGVPIQFNATPAPGDAATEKYIIPDGTSNRLMYVQIRVQNAADLKELVPSVEVFNEQNGTGGPHFFLGAGGFTEIRPIWVPS